jgi:Flp pilus assembly pilin Flp
MTSGRTRRLVVDTRGTSTVEYLLLLCLVVVVCFAAYRALGATVSARVASATVVLADEGGSGASSSGGALVGGSSSALARAGQGSGASFDPAADPAPDAVLTASPGRPSPPPRSQPTRGRPSPRGGGSGGGRSATTPLDRAEETQRARRIVDALTQGDRETTRAVRFQLSQLPLGDLETLEAAGVRVVVGSAADHLSPEEADAQVPGTPPGTTIRTFDPALYDPKQRLIVVPPQRSGDVVHEAAHALDHARGWESLRREFDTARDAELDRLDPYLRQGGSGDQRGLQETYAESYHQYHQHRAQGTLDQMRAEHPHLHDYWAKRSD